MNEKLAKQLYNSVIHLLRSTESAYSIVPGYVINETFDSPDEITAFCEEHNLLRWSHDVERNEYFFINKEPK